MIPGSMLYVVPSGQAGRQVQAGPSRAAAAAKAAVHVMHDVMTFTMVVTINDLKFKFFPHLLVIRLKLRQVLVVQVLLVVFCPHCCCQL